MVAKKKSKGGKSTARGKREAQIASPVPQSAGYNPLSHMHFVRDSLQEQPIFSITMADLMLLDHQVWFGVCAGNAPLITAEVKIDGPDAAVNEFIADQFRGLWNENVSRIVRAEYYGWMAYEAMYQEEDGLLKFDRLIDFHPIDVKPLRYKLERVGFELSNNRSMFLGHRTAPGDNKILGMKALWLTHQAKYGSSFGESLLSRAYSPWWEKAQKGGAIALRKLRMFKDAWLGVRLRYPFSRAFQTPEGQQVSGRDIAREIVDMIQSGATVVLPSDKEGGDYAFDLETPTAVAGANDILAWVDQLDADIFDGLLVPKEVVEASASGSGYAGRTFPFLVFLSIRDQMLADFVRQIDQQILRKLAVVNFGYTRAKSYEIEPVPLIETVGKQLGEGKEGAGQGQGQPSQQGSGQPPPQAPMMQGGLRGGIQGTRGAGMPMQFDSDADADQPAHSYSSTQLEIPEPLAGKIRALANTIPAEYLAEDGRETEPHVTLKYGLHTELAQDVVPLLEGECPIQFVLGDVSLFKADEASPQRGSPQYDVVKIDVYSDQLHRLYGKLTTALPNTSTHPAYQPHLTLAYVKPGSPVAIGECELTGVSVTLDEVVFSSKSGERTTIKLRGIPDFSPPPPLPIAVEPIAEIAVSGPAVPQAPFDWQFSDDDPPGPPDEPFRGKFPSHRLGEAAARLGAEFGAEAERLAREIFTEEAMRDGNPMELIATYRERLLLAKPEIDQKILDTILSGWTAGAAEAATRAPAPEDPPDSILSLPASQGIEGGESIEHDNLLLARDAIKQIAGEAMSGPGGPSEPGGLYNIDEAIDLLSARRVLGPEEYYAVAAQARQQAFTISGGLIDESIAKVQQVLTENLRRGASTDEFIQSVREEIGALPLGERHMEMVFRNNANEAFSQGMEQTLSQPILDAGFPYAMLWPVQDDRVREEHAELAKLGLNGTNIFLRSDPTWLKFRPPWDWGCRCGWAPCSIRQAANRGVQHAQAWLAAITEARKTGQYDGDPAPYMPAAEYVDMPNFQPSPSWRRS